MADMTSLAANMARFTFKFFSGASTPFGVYEFSGREEICRPYHFDIELVSRDANIDITGQLGSPALLSIRDRSDGTRLVHGLVAAMEQLHTANVFTHYRVQIVPRLWFLGQMRDHRIFQNLSVVQIIQKILKEQGFPGEMQAFKLYYSYKPREYCVQYGETLLHFITRLCEEEGIYFYFEHSETTHCLTFSDREGGPRIAGKSNLRYFPGSGQVPDTTVISRIAFRHRVNSNAATYREWNFTRPKLDLESHKMEAGHEPAPSPRGMMMEQYQYPHLYDSRGDGERYADLQIKRQLTFRKWIEAASDASRYLPGYSFEINEHPRDEINAVWWAVTVTHQGEQPGILEHEAPSGRGLNYQCQVVAIPFWTRYVPAIEHPKDRVIGEQTAIVTGPKGEEIYPDKYGRVKVQFHWDRYGKRDEKTTCWIRVAQGWAGPTYGAMAIPRIDHEVIVSFLEGDPDRPLITGRVYHDLNMPAYELPKHKTRTVFKSMSTPGPKEGARGYNELRIEDMKGKEEIYVHGEKDVNVHVKNDWKEQILNEMHQNVGSFRFTTIGGETHETLKKHRKTELLENDNLTVHADRHIKVNRKWLGRADEEMHLDSGQLMVFSSGEILTLRVGASSITMTPDSICLESPKIYLNCGAGSPAQGTDAAPQLPKDSASTEEADKPKAVIFDKAERQKTEQAGGGGGGGNNEKAADGGHQTVQSQASQNSSTGNNATAHQLSDKGINHLKDIESLRLKPYDDQTGKEISSWTKGATIGYGHLISKDEWNKYKNGITEDQASVLFSDDLQPYLNAVNSNVTSVISQNQFDALTIFSFNIGINSFINSSVLKLINDPTVNTNYSSLESAWKAWNKSHGKEMKGLENRRNSEWNIYSKNDYKTW
jgi:type VI secretion system secreted protein VgrG